MLCKNPFIRDASGKIFKMRTLQGFSLRNAPDVFMDGVPFPCGQCLPCRINKRRVWTLRLMLELFYHDRASFITCTYSDENLPWNLEGMPVLCKKDWQLFMKRLRKYFYPREIRFYSCGEYGSKTFRPHYHCILFGVAPDELDASYLIYNGSSPASVLRNIWSFGRTHVGNVSRESIQYVAGYVTKKFTKRGDKYPEFALMSRRPGIGYKAVAEISKTITQYQLEQKAGRQLRIDGKKWPLGRYLLTKLEKELGIVYNCTDYLESLSQLSIVASRQNKDLLELVIEQGSQQVKRLESRDKIFNQRNAI